VTENARDSKRRFSSRVENYVKYRPGYPAALVELLARECGLTRDTVVADVGSGTGILTELLLRNGNRVVGVEPNADMRDAAERLLAGYPNFVSVAGSAEATTLDAASVGVVVAGQAFHWFDHAAARREFARILAPGGHVALVWNVRRVDASAFMTEYEALLRAFGTDYEQVSHHGVDERELDAFFGPGRYASFVLPNAQAFDYAGLEGRLLSSSYVPNVGEPRYEEMLAALGELFARHEVDGKVAFDYDTKVFCGRLDA
jgi:SAM-dependent methyltransferase